MKCRFCKTELENIFIDLVNSPASNSFLTPVQLNEPELYFPLRVYTCPKCFLVQVDEYKKSDAIFDNEYVYFSSYSTSWLKHAKDYTDLMVSRFGYNENSMVIEVASNDGYLLQYFKEKNIPVLGIEPTADTAAVASEKGIESVVAFLGTKLANELASKNIKADLLIGNNVLAHVPDIVDFVGSLKIILKETGVITMEFPHLMQLIDHNQFDTIYHEHFSYLSFTTVRDIFASQGLEMFDVEELTTHGGSLRIYAKHQDDTTKPVSENVTALLEKELVKGMRTLHYYNNFQQRVLNIKMDFIEFLIEQKRSGKRVAAYGAAAKGNTMLNFCGIKNDLIDFVVDANPHKQNKFLPGSHIPVTSIESMREFKPAYVIVFPWNLIDEILDYLSFVKDWGGKLVTFIPAIKEY